MAAPAYVTASTGASLTTGSGGFGTISGLSIGDVVILQVLQDGTGSAPTLDSATRIEALDGTVSTMTSIGSFDVGSPTAGTQHLWIGRVFAVDGAVAVTVSTPADDLYGRLYGFSGVNTGTALSDVIENATAGTATNGAGAAAQIDDTSVQTLAADRLALQLVAVNDDNAVESFTSETGGDWTEAVAEFAAAAGTDGCVQLQTATIASAGTINGGSYTMAAIDSWGVVGFALIPTGAAPPASAPKRLTLLGVG